MRIAGAAGEALIKPVHGADEESAGAVLRGHMHFYALIPVVAILVSAAFGSVSIAWNSDRRASRAMCAIFACTGVWALLDLMTFLESDPVRARFWIQWMHLPALLLGPSTTWLLGQMLPQLDDRLHRLARGGFVVAAILGVSAALLPGSVLDVVATDWGSWAPRYGIVSILVVPIGTVLPLLAAYEASRVAARGESERIDSGRARAVMLGIFISLFAAISTEYVMPVFEWPAPRLGAVAIASASALMWFRVLHASDDLAVTPEGMARSMLEELHDGVALVRLDGTILASNRRFAEMTGSENAELIGESLENRIETPLDEICAGLEDCESVLHRVDGGSHLVSLSSSIARDHAGEALEAVVVFRDLREIDGLRRRLLTSGRLAAIGGLAAGIAHEVNNPVAFICSDLNLLSKRVKEIRNHALGASEFDADPEIFDRVAHRVELAISGVERVAEVVGDVRGFAHMGGAGQGGSDPSVLVEGAMRLARLQCGDDVELRVVDCACIDWIDSGQELKQVLLELILVLVDGVEKGGSIDATLDSDGEMLGITLSAERLVEDADTMIRRFEMLGVGELCDSRTELGLAIATELLDQLGASFSLVDTGPKALSIALRLPLEAVAI
jgi:PAS domain S-box-containing protein